MVFTDPSLQSGDPGFGEKVMETGKPKPKPKPKPKDNGPTMIAQERKNNFKKNRK